MKAVPSRGNPQKWGCSQCDYGHDVGKSRNAVYKHFKAHHQTNIENPSNSTKSEEFSTGSQYPDPESPKITQNPENDENEDFVKNESISNDENPSNSTETGWGEIDWNESDSGEAPKTRTIPNAVKMAGQGFDPRTQGHLVRMGFKALDRALSHYGRGVMSNPEYSIERSEGDYDALEQSTVDMMVHYGVSVPVNPLMLWSVTVGSAYAPPLMHIRKNADPNRPKKGLLRGLFGRLRRRRGKTTTYTQEDLLERRE